MCFKYCLPQKFSANVSTKGRNKKNRQNTQRSDEGDIYSLYFFSTYIRLVIIHVSTERWIDSLQSTQSTAKTNDLSSSCRTSGSCLSIFPDVENGARARIPSGSHFSRNHRGRRKLENAHEKCSFLLRDSGGGGKFRKRCSLYRCIRAVCETRAWKMTWSSKAP